jgi:hypothetical protein
MYTAEIFNTKYLIRAVMVVVIVVGVLVVVVVVVVVNCQSIKNCKHVIFSHKLPLFCITPKRLLKGSVPSSQLFCNHNSLSTVAV